MLCHPYLCAVQNRNKYSSLQILKEEGIRGFYRGCYTNLIRTTPAAAVTFTSFELLSRYLRELAEEKRLASLPRMSSIEEGALPVKLSGKVV